MSSQDDSMGKHDVTDTALHTTLACIFLIEEIVKRHGELSHCLMTPVDIPAQSEIKAKATEEPVFVNVINRAAASYYHVVEHTTLNSAFLTSEAETATRTTVGIHEASRPTAKSPIYLNGFLKALR